MPKTQQIQTSLPTTMGDYEVQGKPIAQGGMASIFKVLDPSGKPFVAKVLHPELLRDKKKRDRFASEFEILSKVRSKNIVKPHELILEKSMHAIIMEYVEGYELRELIKKFAPFSELIALHILRELCVALQVCHQQGFYHRDLKPENILITPQGEIKLIDFGVARDMDTKRTLPGTVLGTVDYMAPEQIEGQWNELDQRSDLYSLGVIVYQMFYKKLPIKFSSRDSIVQVLEKKKKLPKPGKFEPQIMEELCLILMEPDRSRRPAHIEEVMDFLKKYHKFSGSQKNFQIWMSECLNNQKKKRPNQSPKKPIIDKPSEHSNLVEKTSEDNPKPQGSDWLETVMIYTVIVLGCCVIGALLKVWLQGKLFN